MQNEQVSLTNLGYGGAAIELFNAELKKVLENILDENTDAKAAREITLKVKIKPVETRESAAIAIQASSKLAPIKPFPTTLFFDRDVDGSAVAVEYDPKQMHMFRGPGSQETNDKVIPMKGKEGAAE